mmetsp:Transcript_47180/g.53311  ORF Transcript_47180/g.53311 Transcript_47180/m.53311 type:complete len:104 (+) Transcript_47180:632-943(+)
MKEAGTRIEVEEEETGIQCISGSRYNIVIATTNATTNYVIIINNIIQNSYKLWLKCKNITNDGGCRSSSSSSKECQKQRMTTKRRSVIERKNTDEPNKLPLKP